MTSNSCGWRSGPRSPLDRGDLRFLPVWPAYSLAIGPEKVVQIHCRHDDVAMLVAANAFQILSGSSSARPSAMTITPTLCLRARGRIVNTIRLTTLSTFIVLLAHQPGFRMNASSVRVWAVDILDANDEAGFAGMASRRPAAALRPIDSTRSSTVGLGIGDQIRTSPPRKSTAVKYPNVKSMPL